MTFQKLLTIVPDWFEIVFFYCDISLKFITTMIPWSNIRFRACVGVSHVSYTRKSLQILLYDRFLLLSLIRWARTSHYPLCFRLIKKEWTLFSKSFKKTCFFFPFAVPVFLCIFSSACVFFFIMYLCILLFMYLCISVALWLCCSVAL